MYRVGQEPDCILKVSNSRIGLITCMLSQNRVLYIKLFSFYHANSYASVVLAVVILSVRPSVCLSARPSVTRVLCDKTKQCTADSVIHMKGHSGFWHQQWLVADSPFCLKFALKVTHPFKKRRLWQISAYNVSTVRDGEISSIMTHRKSITGFPTSYK